MLGKKGHRYNMYLEEMGMQLIASELSTSQAVYCLTVFMMKTHPDLVAGVDYRIRYLENLLSRSGQKAFTTLFVS
jgi:hypothetical protein